MTLLSMEFALEQNSSSFCHKPLHLSFQMSPHFVFMSVSKESIQTLICDFACRNDSIEKKKKENLLVVFV